MNDWLDEFLDCEFEKDLFNGIKIRVVNDIDNGCIRLLSSSPDLGQSPSGLNEDEKK